MKTIELNENHNMIIDNLGNIATINNVEALAQDLSTSLLMNQGENPFDTNEGINYDDNILGKMGGIDYLKDQFLNRINENEEVVNVANIEIRNVDKTLQVQTDINTIYGAINL